MIWIFIIYSMNIILNTHSSHVHLLIIINLDIHYLFNEYYFAYSFEISIIKLNIHESFNEYHFWIFIRGWFRVILILRSFLQYFWLKYSLEYLCNSSNSFRNDLSSLGYYLRPSSIMYIPMSLFNIIISRKVLKTLFFVQSCLSNNKGTLLEKCYLSCDCPVINYSFHSQLGCYYPWNFVYPLIIRGVRMLEQVGIH